jgi:hypothetical protein
MALPFGRKAIYFHVLEFRRELDDEPISTDVIAQD